MLENLYLYFLELFTLSGDKEFTLWFPSFDNGGWISSVVSWNIFSQTLSIVCALIVFISILLFMFKLFRWAIGVFFAR